MADIANLVLAVDSTQIPPATAALDGLTAAGSRAEAATAGLGGGFKGAGVEASAMAAAAQLSASASMTQAAAFTASADASRVNTMAMRESLVVARELARGNYSRVPGSLTLLAQGVSSGGGIGAFAASLAQTIGLITTMTATEAAEEAANAAASEAAVEGAAARATANVLAADTQLALAQAAVRTAETETASTAAAARLAAANDAVAAASTEAAIAENALAVAQERATVTGAAAAAATTTSMTALGVALTSVAALAALAFGVWLIERLTDTGAAVDKLVKKLDEKYQKTMLEAEANEKWANSLDGVAAAMDTIADKVAKTFTTEAVTQADEMAVAQRDLLKATQQRTAAQDALNKAVAAASAPQVGIGQGGGPGLSNPGADAAVVKAQKTLASANTAVAEASRALSNLQIATAVVQGKTMADVGSVLGKRIADAEATIEQRATDADPTGLAVKASIASETEALERLRKAFTDTAGAGDVVQKQAVTMNTAMEHLVDQLDHGIIGPDKFAKSILGMASALAAAADAAKKNKNPILDFEKSVLGAEGTGANKMGSSAFGYGQFMPATWMDYFNKAFPAQVSALSDAAKLAFRSNESVAKAVVDAAAHDYAEHLKAAGLEVTKANLYAFHLLSAGTTGKTAIRLLTAPGPEATSDFLSSAVLRGNPFLAGTADQARGAIAKRIGDSSSPISQGTQALVKWMAESQKALDQLDLDISGQYSLAGAYTQGIGAALKAEAQEKANAEGLKLHADAATIAAVAEKGLQKIVADDVASHAKQLASTNEEIAARAKVNQMVAAGIIPASQASEQVKLETELTKLRNDYDNAATIPQKQQILDVINQTIASQTALNAANADAQALQQIASNDNDIAKMRLENSLLGQSNTERAIAIAQLEAVQKLNALGVNDPLTRANYVNSEVNKAVAGVQSPFQQWAKDIHTSAPGIRDDLESIAFKGFDQLASGIAGVVTGTESLGKAFKDVANSIISDIVQMTVKMLIFRAISSVFGGIGGAGASGGSYAPPATHFANGGSMIIGGNPGVDRNVLSLNGSPVAMVGQGETLSVFPNRPAANSNSRQIVEVHVVTDENFNATVKQISGSNIVEAAPQLIAQAVKSTFQVANRPTLAGRR